MPTRKPAAGQTKEELLTSAKIAEKLGVKPADVKKAIEKLGLQPDVKRGACAYYGPASVKRIAQELGRSS